MTMCIFYLMIFFKYVFLFQLRIEESATKKQARVDTMEDGNTYIYQVTSYEIITQIFSPQILLFKVVVGVNKYRLASEQRIDVLKINNNDVREKQVARIKKVKAERDPVKVKAALDKLTASARLTESTGPGGNPNNLLKLAVEAARARATLGEISSALESVWGRHVATSQVVQGAYSASFNSADEQDNDFKAVLAQVQRELSWIVNNL